MRSRTNPIIIRLSDEELADLNEKVSKVRVPVSGLSGSVSAALPSGRPPPSMYRS